MSKQTSLASTLVSRRHLERVRADARPRLNAKGAIRRTTLELCDGSRTFDEIVTAVLERHRAVLRTRERAVALVAGWLRGHLQ